MLRTLTRINNTTCKKSLVLGFLFANLHSSEQPAGYDKHRV